MGLKRYKPSADATITNAWKSDLETRATGSNTGGADILEIFHIYGAASTTIVASASEDSRVLMKFPISDVSTDRSAGTIPASGSVSFYLKLFNAEHANTLPSDYKIVVHPLSGASASVWAEGTGMDMTTYLDNGYTNWTASYSSSVDGESFWENEGGDFFSGSGYTYTYDIDKGTEDVVLDVTQLVEDWITGSAGGKYENYGIVVKLSSSYETAKSSYYTKKFFSRSSQYFFKRPVLEARWDSTRKDKRGDFYFSSSLAPASDNLNTLYLYNYIRGNLRNIPGVDQGAILVSLYSGSAKNTSPSGAALQMSVGGDVATDLDTNATGGWIATGIYSCSVCITSSSTAPAQIFDMWHSGGTEYHTGTIYPQELKAYSYNPTEKYISKITNLRSVYYPTETARFRMFIRQKDWSPTIYSKATKELPNYLIESASYKIIRVADDLEVIPYGTGSDQFTALSYDVSGNYFDLDMGILEPDYAYALKFAYYNGALGAYEEQKEEFRFRVEKHEP